MQRLVRPVFHKRHKNPVVVLAINANGFGLDSVFHKADCFVQLDRRFVGHVHLQVHPIHTVVRGVFKRSVYNLPAQSSTTKPR